MAQRAPVRPGIAFDGVRLLGLVDQPKRLEMEGLCLRPGGASQRMMRVPGDLVSIVESTRAR